MSMLLCFHPGHCETGSVLWFAGELGFGPRNRRKDVSDTYLPHAMSTQFSNSETASLVLGVPRPLSYHLNKISLLLLLE